MSNTFEQVTTRMASLIGATEESTEYSLDKLQDKARSLYRAVCEGKIIRVRPGNVPAITAKALPFLDRKIPINLKEQSSITENASAGATTLKLDTTNIAASGAVYIKGNLVKYTGKTSTEITGVSGLVIDLLVGDVVRQAFSISSVDVYKPYGLRYQDGEIETECFNRKDGTYNPGSYYKIINDEDQRYLVIVGYSLGLYRLKYMQKPEDLVDGDDVLLLPDNLGVEIISYIGAGEMLRGAEETQFAQEKLALGYKACTEFFDKQGSQIKIPVQQVGRGFTTFQEQF